MVFESIPNFDSYVWVAVGLFVIGLFSVMIYEKSNTSDIKDQDTRPKSEKDIN